MPLWRRVLAVIAFAAIVLFRFDRQLIRLPFINREPLAQALTSTPDRLWPQFPRFVAGVRARTEHGDSIAIIPPSLDWNDGYSYAYYRASYLLAGREVLPVVSEDGTRQTENLTRAKYLAVWGRGVPPGRNIVWQGEGGILLRQ